MKLLKKLSAIKFLLCLCLLPWCLVAKAEIIAGKLVHSSGPVLVKHANGKVRVIEQNADITQGDTLVTDGKTYARIQFTDASEITLSPKSTFIVEQFNYGKTAPEQNRAELNLMRGGLQFTAGEIAKNTKDGFVLKTSLGEIKGGASFILEYTSVSESAIAQAAPMYPTLAFNNAATETQSDIMPDYGIAKVLLALTAPVPGAKAPGLYVQVLDGMIHLTNGGGSQSFTAGQFGYTASFVQPPVVLPANPGIQFTPPPTFSSSTTPSNTSSGKSATVDCEVR